MSTSKPISNIRVASIVTNSCVADARVIKQAESLHEAGAEVTVFCLHKNKTRPYQNINGVNYHRNHINFFTGPYTYMWDAAKKIFTSRGIWSLYYLSLIFIYFGLSAYKIFTALLDLIAHFSKDISELISSSKSKDSNQKKTEEPYHSQKTSGFLLNIHDSIRQVFYNTVIKNLFIYSKYHLFKCIWEKDILEFKPDIIHAHDFNTVPAALEYSKSLGGCPVIFDAHEIEVDREGNNVGWKIWWTERMLKKYAYRIDGLINVNASAQKFYTENYDFKNISKALIYNTPDLSKPNRKETVRDILNLPKDQKIIIYTGGIGTNRGVEEIVVAIKKIPNTHLCIMGPQTPEILRRFNRHLKKHKMFDRVHIIKPVPHWEVTSVIRTADLGVCFTKPTCLNHLYSSPNKLFEMALAGLPMIVPDLPEMAKFVKDENIGIVVDPDNVENLSRSISEILQNPEKYRLSKDNLQSLIDRWAWSSQAEKLVSFYQDLFDIKSVNHATEVSGQKKYA